jgi:HlyD family secretion protein
MDRPIEKKKWTPRRIAALGAAAAIVAIVVFGVVNGTRGTRLRVSEERLRIDAVERGVFQEYIPVIGAVVPVTTHYLDASEGGRVEAVYQEAGGFVEKGDPILKLANTNLLLDVMYREAELVQQSNNLRNTQITMEQNRLQMRRELLDISHDIAKQRRVTDNLTELRKSDLVARQEYEEACEELEYLAEKRSLLLATQRQDSLYREVQVVQLEESLRRMGDNLEIIKLNMEELVIRAPITGQLTALNAEVGESKAKGERLGQVDVLDGFKVRAAIDEFYISRIQRGQTGTFEFSNGTYELGIDKVYPQVVNGRFEIDLLFTGAEPENIRRGQTCHIRLELGELSDATLLPAGGYLQASGGRWVYVIDKSGESAQKREIVLGRRNPKYCEVLSGLVPGDKVITSSYEIFNNADQLVLQN